MSLEIIEEKIKSDGTYKIQFARDNDNQTYRYYHFKWWIPSDEEYPATPGWELISMSGLFKNLEDAECDVSACIDWFEE